MSPNKKVLVFLAEAISHGTFKFFHMSFCELLKTGGVEEIGMKGGNYQTSELYPWGFH